MATLLDRCAFVAAAGGTGSWTVGSTPTGYQSPSAAGVQNGYVYSYFAQSTDLTQWEVGRTTYTSSGGTFSRAVLFSSNANAAVNFTAAPTVNVDALADDIVTHPPECGRLVYSSATQIAFNPLKGNLIKIAGKIYEIPSAGVTAANTGVYVNGTSGQNLAASTTYYVYLFNNAGTLTVDFSTTAHATDTTQGNVGVEIKSGDNSRALIGMVRTNASSQFYDDATQNVGVATWFNRRTRNINSGNTGAANVTATAMTEVGSAYRLQFMSWADESPYVSINGYVANNTAGDFVYTNVGIDGVSSLAITISTRGYCAVANQLYLTAAANGMATLAEGYHYATPAAFVTSSSTGSVTVVASVSVRI